MNIKDHNTLMKIVFDGNKHLKHVMTADEVQKSVHLENRYPLSRMPVCGHCERLALWTRNKQAFCEYCGTYTRTPVTYSSYLASGYDVDKGIANRMMELDKRNKILPSYGE